MYIAGARPSPSAQEYNEPGFVVLRQCITESQQLLAQPFQARASSKKDEEVKVQLRRYVVSVLSKYIAKVYFTVKMSTGVAKVTHRIIIDASIRRFRAYRLYLQVQAALRWIQMRNSILQGQRAHARHEAALQQLRATLQAVR